MLQKVQRRASRWVCGSRWVPHKLAWPKCSDVCIRELEWPLLSTRRKYLSVRLLYDIMHHKYSIKFNDFCTMFPHVLGAIHSLLYHLDLQLTLFAILFL